MRYPDDLGDPRRAGSVHPVRRLSVLLLLLALTIAGCGGDDEADSPAAPGAQSGTVEVGMDELKFDPADITVKVGTKIVWTNLEDIPHNVVSERAGLGSELIQKDGTYEHTVDKPGEFVYVCTLHPGMDGTLTVVE